MASGYVRKWARVKDGLVVELKEAPHEDKAHPFELSEGESAFDVSGVHVFVGYAADSKGNVAPSVGYPKEGAPVYHDRSNPPAHHTAGLASLLYTSEPHPTVHAPDPKAPEPEASAPAPKGKGAKATE
jgi:hypothetical protein